MNERYFEMFNANEGKEIVLSKIKSEKFKDIFIKKNIKNVIVFGSLYNGDFNEESDVDIAFIAEQSIPFSVELEITTELEEFLNREVDLIDINDENINNLIKISALNSKFVVLENEILEEARNKFDVLYKENKEFWYLLDRTVLGFE